MILLYKKFVKLNREIMKQFSFTCPLGKVLSYGILRNNAKILKKIGGM